jgi:hypothetical protein
LGEETQNSVDGALLFHGFRNCGGDRDVRRADGAVRRAGKIRSLRLTNLEPSLFESLPDFCAIICSRGLDHGQDRRCNQRIGHVPASCWCRNVDNYVLVVRNTDPPKKRGAVAPRWCRYQLNRRRCVHSLCRLRFRCDRRRRRVSQRPVMLLSSQANLWLLIP